MKVNYFFVFFSNIFEKEIKWCILISFEDFELTVNGRSSFGMDVRRPWRDGNIEVILRMIERYQRTCRQIEVQESLRNVGLKVHLYECQMCLQVLPDDEIQAHMDNHFSTRDLTADEIPQEINEDLYKCQMCIDEVLPDREMKKHMDTTHPLVFDPTPEEQPLPLFEALSKEATKIFRIFEKKLERMNKFLNGNGCKL